MSRFKISLPGSDITDDNPLNEAVDSLYPSLKVSTLANPFHAGIISVNWSTATITVPSGTTRMLYTFPHKYNYVPTVVGAFHFDNGASIIEGTMPFAYGALAMIVLDADRTNVNLKYYSLNIGNAATTPFLIRVRFYVFAEKGIA